MVCDKKHIIRLDTVDSTNRYLRDEADIQWNKCALGKGFVVVVAGHQSAGRGQRGNIWGSNAGENLLFSILVRPGEQLEVCKQFLLSQVVALSLHDTMRCYGIDTKLKWPNDIYVENRKLAGILVELDYSGAFVEQAIIGIGINEGKQSCISTEKRLQMIGQLYKDEPRVKVEAYSGLTVDFAEKWDASFIIRGIRTVRDFEYEEGIADINRKLTGIETIFLFTEPELTSVSSSVVRELLHYGKDVSAFLPEGMEI